MTDKPKLADLLEMPWDELKVVLCAEIREAMGEKGSWKHYRLTGWPVRCEFCERTWPSWEEWMLTKDVTDCPIPPPITAEPEVVAERLIKQENEFDDGARLLDTLFDLFTPAELRARLKDWYFNDEEAIALYWFAIVATPTQRIIVCLLALGKIEE